jgi:hypothetical protein
LDRAEAGRALRMGQAIPDLHHQSGCSTIDSYRSFGVLRAPGGMGSSLGQTLCTGRNPPDHGASELDRAHAFEGRQQLPRRHRLCIFQHNKFYRNRDWASTFCRRAQHATAWSNQGRALPGSPPELGGARRPSPPAYLATRFRALVVRGKRAGGELTPCHQRRKRRCEAQRPRLAVRATEPSRLGLAQPAWPPDGRIIAQIGEGPACEAPSQR